MFCSCLIATSLSVKGGKVYDNNNKLYTGGMSQSYENGDEYIVNVSNGIISDKGTYIWKNGDKFVGIISDRQIKGKGILTWKNGDKFEGEIIGTTIRKGVLTWKNGSVYKGNFIDNQLVDPVNIKLSNGAKYIGSFIRIADKYEQYSYDSKV